MTTTAKRGPGRPRKTAAADDIEDLIGIDAPDEPASINLDECLQGVSASWLAQMFGHDKNTIRKKLARAGLEIVGQRRGGSLYRLHEAAAHLVKPEVDLVEYIKGLRPNDLPPMLNDAYWSAMLKRQKWEENAADLWRTEDVLKVLGDLNFQVRNTVNLWVEEVDRFEPLTDKQRQVILTQADQLLQLFYNMLVELPNKDRTQPSIAEEGAMPEGGDVQ